MIMEIIQTLLEHHLSLDYKFTNTFAIKWSKA